MSGEAASLSRKKMNGKKEPFKQRMNWYFKNRFKMERELWVISIIALVWLFLFSIVPLYGISYAFFDYYPGMKLADSDFIGFANFIRFFKLPKVWEIFRNTFAISGLNLTIGFIAPIILALLFNELYNSVFKRIIQTISYLPHFVSWVVVASIVFAMLGGDGMVNSLLLRSGIIDHPIPFMTEGKYFWALLVGTNIWKGIGFGSIIYISNLSGVDHELYQAGSVDGLGRFGMVWHISLPSIAPTIILLFILGIGGILNAGFEQQLLLGTPTTRAYYEVIDTFVYQYGYMQGDYTLGIAVGLMKTVVGLVLVFVANTLSRKVTDMSIF